ncbi:MAG TPA: hypothetical protein VF828_03110 [Patescibacteria group bacterium]
MKKGQVALIVLIISAVVLTLGLSLSKKTVTEVKINTDEGMLKQAFNAAESGIDYYLSTGTTSFESVGTTTSAKVQSTPIGGASTLTFGALVDAGRTSYYWLVNHMDNGDVGSTYYSSSATRIDICVDSGFNGGALVDYYYLDASNQYKTKRFGYYFGASPIGNFTQTNGSGTACSSNRGVRFNFGGNLPAGSSLLIAVTPVSQASNISLVGDANFPVQGEEIASTGTAGADPSSQVTTKVRENNIYTIPSFMFWPLSSKDDLRGT